MLRFASIAVVLMTLPMTGIVVSPTAAAASPVLSTSVQQPANLAVRGSQIFVADTGTSTLSRLLSDGSTDVLAAGPQPGEVAGAALSKDGRYLAYTSTESIIPSDPFSAAHQGGTMTILGPLGSRRSVDLAAYENIVNPDADVHYGLEHADVCSYKSFQGHGFNPQYLGPTDSRPASVTAYGKHSWLVVDAGADDVLKVDADGTISTVAVLPAQPLYISLEIATALQMFPCASDVTYDFEALPTDVEVAPNGAIYVSAEVDRAWYPALGPRGRIYRVHPQTGTVTAVASGLDGATNLAVRRGKIYVAERYANRISVIKNGKAELYRALPGALSVEARGGRLYAGAESPGRIVRLR